MTDAPKDLDDLLKRYKNETEYLESIKRTEFGDDVLWIYKRFIQELEPICAALTQPRADVEEIRQELIEINTEDNMPVHEQLKMRHYIEKSVKHLAARGFGVPDPDFLRQNVHEQIEEGGYWSSCSGCHETNEGYATGNYSDIFKTHLGMGCHECGGIGAVWYQPDDDMEAMIKAAPKKEGAE